MQFVTFRLGDALPISKVRNWQEERRIWMARNPKPWSAEVEKGYHRRFTKRLEEWMDAGVGSCIFKDARNREILQEVFLRDHGERAIFEAWVIMPNHVHALFLPKVPTETLLKTWKGVSARRFGIGKIWQKNYRDTLIRDSEHFANVVKYIRRNPLKLDDGHFTLWESERAQSVR